MSDHPTPTRDSLSGGPAEDRSASDQTSAPHDQSPASGQAVCLRQTPRQATSAVAYVGEPPEDDDPLLGFAPYVHAAPRRNSITPDLQRRFVATLAATGIVKQAARSIGRSLEALYKLRHKPGAEGFAQAWDAALERSVARLEEVALQRSLVGTRTPIVSSGEILGWWDKPDNHLLRFLLQHRRPTTYGTQQLRPGHPVYDSIRAEVEAEIAARHEVEQRDAAARARVIIDRKLEELRDRVIAREERREATERAAAEARGEVWNPSHPDCAKCRMDGRDGASE